MIGLRVVTRGQGGRVVWKQGGRVTGRHGDTVVGIVKVGVVVLLVVVVVVRLVVVVVRLVVVVGGGTVRAVVEGGHLGGWYPFWGGGRVTIPGGGEISSWKFEQGGGVSVGDGEVVGGGPYSNVTIIFRPNCLIIKEI